MHVYKLQMIIANFYLGHTFTADWYNQNTGLRDEVCFS